MKVAVALAALGSAALAAAQCQSSIDGIYTFNYQRTGPGPGKRDLGAEAGLDKRAQLCGTNIAVRLINGRLLDRKGRTGYIVGDNHQLQFDAPPQACPESVDNFCATNGALAIDGDTTFYNCNSGGFNNIYSQPLTEKCYKVELQLVPCVGADVPSQASNTVPAPDESTCTNKPKSYKTPSGSASASATSESSSSAEAVSTPSSISSVYVSSSTPVATPYPVPGNGTTPAATGSAAPPVTSAPGGAATNVAPPPSTFTGAANIVAAGQKVVGVLAGVAAMAML